MLLVISSAINLNIFSLFIYFLCIIKKKSLMTIFVKEPSVLPFEEFPFKGASYLAYCCSLCT